MRNAQNEPRKCQYSSKFYRLLSIITIVKDGQKMGKLRASIFFFFGIEPKLWRTKLNTQLNSLSPPPPISQFYHIVQKMRFSIKNFFSKCDQIRRKLQIRSHLLHRVDHLNISAILPENIWFLSRCKYIIGRKSLVIVTL